MKTYEIEDIAIYDYYDVNMEDDIQEASTDLTELVAQNWTIPYPADADDPNEAILVKEIEIYPTDEMLATVAESIYNSTNSNTGIEFLNNYFGFFTFDEVDETLGVYRDEVKEAIARAMLSHVVPSHDTDLATGSIRNVSTIQTELEALIKFKRPVIFPLNMSLKTFVVQDGTDGLVLDDVDGGFNYKFRYRIVRQPLDFLGRILALMRQELTA